MDSIKPKVSQESVWDYPRLPRLEDVKKYVQVVFNGVPIASSSSAKRVLAMGRPPVYYIPKQDVLMEFLHETEKTSFCEFKGVAHYYTVKVQGKEAVDAAWFYPRPCKGYERLKHYVAFYPSKMEACYVDNEKVRAQEEGCRPGDCYEGWITSNIVGPFKGSPGNR